MVRENIDIIKASEEIREDLLNWFLNNKMKLHTNKCRLIWNSQEANTLKIGYLHINKSLSEKLLGITFDCKWKPSKHIEDICQTYITQAKHTRRTCTIHGNNQNTYSKLFETFRFPGGLGPTTSHKNSETSLWSTIY